ncbi:hypothetical protein F4553_001725 [Allocatelliglobosispora scoriae]|uniref:Uncharacterized protein n=1 Tax=Allocatelliglobosispora scoriae TaxID=643052 RepID=A0A841BM61_9ACTN|nr:hypothetical protein [Allocatelliglobosispora scoriae]MBB5868346.1 hypothetical protein [Allocatelliglobosispora scoriae]
MATSRHDFRFVVDGVDLTEAQRVRIANEIQKAGLAALQNASVNLLRPITVGHANWPVLRPEWYGLWVIDGPRADQVGQQINAIGFYQ